MWLSLKSWDESIYIGMVAKCAKGFVGGHGLMEGRWILSGVDDRSIDSLSIVYGPYKQVRAYRRARVHRTCIIFQQACGLLE